MKLDSCLTLLYCFTLLRFKNIKPERDSLFTFAGFAKQKLTSSDVTQLSVQLRVTYFHERCSSPSGPKRRRHLISNPIF